MEMRRVFLLRSSLLFVWFISISHSSSRFVQFRFLLFIMKNCCNKNANGAQRIRMHTEQIVHLIDLPGMHFYGTHFAMVNHLKCLYIKLILNLSVSARSTFRIFHSFSSHSVVR